MNTATVDRNQVNTLRRCLRHVRDWPTIGNGPYSPLVCVTLLLAIGLAAEIGR